ncbi:flagellar export protein FliJ [Denitratisoma oestradiolicum]|uniref:Flagellar FliJ protein n=1 Tax=Denitratisoma oestradiolicum TaxID=311182 RepID=A0A6S6YS29_9PROT|nr:flagellar export protein FliJ [Denitratisoma oestradiolicum]TWO81584.1 flagellar export protein FliJ [Denitratisoma oestradiolicum]CAB1370522.1 Flagellar export protein FliJ [Denitratisoma oestradiolicum]
MSTRFPLQTLLDLSQMRLDETTRRLGELIAGEQEAAQRLEMLIQYRAEYNGRFIEAAQNGLGRDQWRNFQSFLDRLDTAIDQARDAVSLSQQRTAAGQQEWLSKRGQVKAYDTLAERHEDRQRHAEHRQDQKAQDEHAARRPEENESHQE